MKTLFEYRDYRAYLNDRIHERARGERTRLAEHLHCHLTYISQVLGGTAHLSPEQAQSLNRYYGHSGEESDFFLNLVLLARAGSPELERYYLTKIEQILERRLILKDRLKYKQTLNPVDQATYYSSWHYTAVHFALTIPRLQTRDAIARYLGLAPAIVSAALEFLLSVGIAREEKGRFTTGATSIHLGNDSPMLPKHHANWRIQALRSLDLAGPDDFHYTSVVTLAKSDLVKIKSLMVSAIEQIRPVIRESPEEGLYCYSMDLFGVTRE
ncbi:MAG: TIGR02147 family protein [Oligoflexia bacterium]|nr:TIGR02147 family protein [Oligoflexia bacterium]